MLDDVTCFNEKGRSKDYQGYSRDEIYCEGDLKYFLMISCDVLWLWYCINHLAVLLEYIYHTGSVSFSPVFSLRRV